MEWLIIVVGIVLLLFLGNLGDKLTELGSQTESQETPSDDVPKEHDMAPRLRIIDDKVSDKADALIVKRIQFKGPFPIPAIYWRASVEFVTSVFVKDTSGELKPVFSMLDRLQETRTPAYCIKKRIGQVEAGMGTRDWLTIGAIFPQIMQPPYGGACDIIVRVRLVDLQADAQIIAGLPLDKDAVLWERDITFRHEFEEKGYEEKVKDRDEAQIISIKIAVEVAMADGELHPREGDVIRTWVDKTIGAFSEGEKKRHKALYKVALKEAYTQAQEDLERAGFTTTSQSRQKARLSPLLSRLRAINEKKVMYDVVELSYDIMTADGRIAKEEMTLLRFIEKGVGLDAKELEAIRDKKMIAVPADELSGELSLEERLGIDPQWGKDKINAHIRKEYAKWNGRMSTLSSPEERANAQRMLDDLGKARKKYGQ